MNEEERRIHLERLWNSRVPGRSRTVLEESQGLANHYAHRYRAQDPANAAGEAIIHMIQQASRHLEKFLLSDGELLVENFCRYRARIIQNKVLEIVRREAGGPGVEDDPFGTLQVIDLDPANDPLHLLMEQQELEIALTLIAGLKEVYQHILLCSLAGFGLDQVSVRLKYTKESLTVLKVKIKDQLADRASKRAISSKGRLEDPRGDVPLWTHQTPCLQSAISRCPPPEGLLDAILRLTTPGPFRFLARMARFWDCVVATVLDESTQEHRTALSRLRTEIEVSLAKGNEVLPPGPPKREDKSWGNPMQSRDKNLPRGEMEFLEEVISLAETSAFEALRLLMTSPAMHTGLTRGSPDEAVSHLAVSQAIDAAPGSTAARLLVAARENVRSALNWLTLPGPEEAGAVPVRRRSSQKRRELEQIEVPDADTDTGNVRRVGEPVGVSGAQRLPVEQQSGVEWPAEENCGADPEPRWAGQLRNPSEPVTIALNAVTDQEADFHLFVWQCDLRSLKPELLHPMHQTDPTLGKDIPVGWQLVAQAPAGACSLAVIVVWSPELPPDAWMSDPYGSQEKILAWLLERYSGANQGGTQVHLSVIDP